MRERRERLGLSQKQTAEKAGLSAGYISQVESGRRSDPQFSSVMRICNALGLSLDELANTLAGRSRTSIRNGGRDRATMQKVKQLASHVAAIQNVLSDLTEGLEKGP